MKTMFPAAFIALSMCSGALYAVSDFVNDSAGYDPYLMPPDMQDNSSQVPATSNGFTYAAPANPYVPYLIPNEFSYEYLGPMKADGGGSHLSITNVKISMPLSDPHRSGWSSWHFDAKVSLKMTWINSSGEDPIDLDRLYTVTPLIGISRKMGSSGMFSIAFTPQLSSDLDTASAHNFYFGGFAAYSSALGENFTYSVGVACMPDYSNTWLLPIIQFAWRAAPNWCLKLEAARLSFDNVASERFEWGPFFTFNSGTWTVRRHLRTEQFRWSSCVLGLGGALNLTPNQPSKLLLKADTGFTFANKAKFRTKNGKHDLTTYDYDPGFYIKAGLELRF
ncbi:MAG: DUF6268 family outer membrane beta-barrel protein [Akkermansiaceae bacterium]|nr:DUF6268 family outer membrane beta-barrel protein [Akkermansiaceae bacterium]